MPQAIQRMQLAIREWKGGCDYCSGAHAKCVTINPEIRFASGKCERHAQDTVADGCHRQRRRGTNGGSVFTGTRLSAFRFLCLDFRNLRPTPCQRL